jgi:hypothetical protein
LLVSSRRIAGDGGTLPGRYVLADKTDLLDNVLALRQNMAIKELYVVIRNDGEVAVIIPFAFGVLEKASHPPSEKSAARATIPAQTEFWEA